MSKKTTKQEMSSGKIDFIGKSKFFAMVSMVLVLGAFALILTKGLKYGIDFAGGTEVQVQFQDAVQAGQVRSFLNSLNMKGAQVQSFGEQNEFLIRLERAEGKSNKETNEILKGTIESLTSGLTENFASQGPVIRRVDSVGPQVGSELKRNGILAVFYSLILILIYIGLRFDYNFAPGAVTCLFHDTMITLGLLVLLGKEINVQILAALLTIIGYSLNDTIVVFDRIREDLDVYRDKKLPWVINHSINSTLSRTLMTSITTMIAVLALFFLAGGVIKDFAFAMAVGIVVGTYSSIYVASPMIILFDRFKPDREQRA